MKRMYFFFVLCVLLIYVPCAFSDEDGEKFPPQALLAAAYRGDVAIMREILAAQPDKDTRDSLGATALHVAVLQSNPAMVQLLLEHGFDPNARATQNGYTPLHNAVAVNNVEAARLLLAYKADKNIKNLKGLTPYEMAISEQKRQLVLLLYK